MNGLTLGLMIGGTVAGGALGVLGSFYYMMAHFWGGGAQNVSSARWGIVGAFMGAAVGGGAGWLFSGGPQDMMNARQEQATISECMNKAPGQKVVIARNDKGEITCAPAP